MRRSTDQAARQAFLRLVGEEPERQEIHWDETDEEALRVGKAARKGSEAYGMGSIRAQCAERRNLRAA